MPSSQRWLGVCPEKNLTVTMHIVFSDDFEKSSSTFVNHLEGARKILEVSPGRLP
jgi:hypothetical protein